ncbi:pentapeptide repeat-containing protein [Nocardia sp. NPDC059240]|uniref:pentapeptide repeat-containing protein n=1 Tax=Nocardia sp. NPDC059240 TaxID=3346786 RepID=UPI00367648A9
MQNLVMFGWARTVDVRARRQLMMTMQAYITKNGRVQLRRRAARIQLFPAVGSALAIGLFVACAAYGVLWLITPTSNVAAAPIDLTKVALTVVAGVGGVVALVIAYRRQRDLERGRFVERFGAAAAQLGATDVAVRLAGVYALTVVADESDEPHRQQCIEVLCGYLRLPYYASQGANHQTKRIRKWHDSHEQPESDVEDHFEYRQNDREVRATIVRVIADHLRPGAEYGWSANDFDFRTAHLENVDFSRATFSGDARFDRATFSGGTLFDGVTFFGDADFGSATFSGDTRFDRATFSRNADFRRTTFSDDAGFFKAIFSRNTQFIEATFSGTARFGGVTFVEDAWFGGATFSMVADFGGATFSKDADFSCATFSRDAEFDEATFSRNTRFEKVDFGDALASFRDPKQWGPPAPVFDWDGDVTRKPANVEPQDWPPTTRTVS